MNSKVTNPIYSDKIVVCPEKDVTYNEPRGLGYVLYQKLLKFKNKLLLIDANTDEKLTFEQFRTKCIRTALHMKSRGLVPTDKVSICLENSMNSLVPVVASIFIGVVPNTLDNSFTIDDYKYYLDIIKPKLIFVSEKVKPKISAAVKSLNLDTEILLFEKTKEGSALDEFYKAVDGEENFEPYQTFSSNDTAVILFSSGTTGKPKAICLNHRYFYDDLEQEDEIILLCLSNLYWISQLYLSMMQIIRGFAKVVYPKFDSVENYCKIMKKYKVNGVYLAACDFVEVLHYCSDNKISFVTTYVIVGGSSVAKNHLPLALNVFPNAFLVNTYGSTEAQTITNAFHDRPFTIEQLQKTFLKGSVGKVVKGVSVKIVDRETAEILGPNQIGEIVIDSKLTMNGYYKATSSDIYDEDGWMKTGDLGYYDENEYFYITGRCKQMIKYKNYPVHPYFLEDILSGHPAVHLSVVIGKPHDFDGEHPIAFVKLKKGYAVKPEELRQFVDDKVDDRKKLRGGVVIVDDIPISPTGKPLRKHFEALVRNNKA